LLNGGPDTESLCPLSNPEVAKVLEKTGIERFYTHQVQAIDAIRGGQDVAIVTSTASGQKPSAYNVPVLERVGYEPNAKALYLFPTKALGPGSIKRLVRYVELDPFTSYDPRHRYDGDTPS